MIILALFIFSALAEVPVLAKVVDDFGACSAFFFESTEPQGMDQNATKICQQYGGRDFYVSLYSTFHRIPIYSAYIFNSSCQNQSGGKSGYWFIEPQLSGDSQQSMESEKHNDKARLKSKQALNGDYSSTGFDRGQLNTNSFQCDDGRIATFTLTNSAPMDAGFNRAHWTKWKNGVKGILKAQPAGKGTAYLVTGTVPSSDYRIPRQGESDDPSARDFNRVTVPTHVWTAVCYKHKVDEEKSFSFGYIGLNQPDSKINVKTVTQLNHQLSAMYSSMVNIFKDDCFSTNLKSEEIIKQLYKNIQLPLSDKLSMSDDVLNKFHTDSASVLSQQFTGPIKSLSSTQIPKRDSIDDSQELLSSLIPGQISNSVNSCPYNEKARGYYCDGGTVRCSPQYSAITIKGTRCNCDTNCGVYKQNYYWCYVGSSWEYCSPPPKPLGKTIEGVDCRDNYNCAYYSYSSTQCKIDHSDNTHSCCMIPDKYSGINGRTCMADHPCNYYGANYLWCYTTTGWWQYCCTAS